MKCTVHVIFQPQDYIRSPQRVSVQRTALEILTYILTLAAFMILLPVNVKLSRFILGITDVHSCNSTLQLERAKHIPRGVTALVFLLGSCSAYSNKHTR